MSAVRLARGSTGRNRIVKFEGCYHGHGDSFLIAAGSGLLTHGVPSSPGVTPGTASDTLLAPFNDLERVSELFEQEGEDIACVIIEPIAGNMGVIAADQEFLAGLRALCDQHGALLIFDEVMTGFRVAFGGAAELYGVVPDLVTYGKIIGGGLPVGAYGGRREVMDVVSPVGPVYQAGTLSGNPLAVAAGLATLNTLLETNPYARLEQMGERLQQGIEAVLQKNNALPGTVNRVGSMVTLFFANTPVRTYSDAVRSNTDLFARFFHGMLEEAVYLPPSQFEAWFLSAAHTDEDVDQTLEAVSRVMVTLPAEVEPS